MELYDLIKNIQGKNNEEELNKCIIKIKEELKGLTKDRTCKIYSSYLYEELLKRTIPARIINTLDIGLNYEHFFILVPDNKEGYFLSDLTFSQFNSNDFIDLIDKGYMKIDNNNFSSYLNIIEKII